MIFARLFLALDQTQPAIDIDAAVIRLLGMPPLSVRPATGGGNNRVIRVETKNGIYAIKFYPRQDADPRDRLSHEYAALMLMGSRGIECVPRVIKSDATLNCAAYTWIDGDLSGQINDNDVDAMSAFAKALASMANAPGAAAISPASASCFTGADCVRQFATRAHRLREVTEDVALCAFIDDRLTPGFEAYARRARVTFDAAGLDFEQPLESARRTLSPSDFGFHNTIRRADGSLVFLDFEYFGWDDPVKMIADAVWHPGSIMSAGAACRFQADMLDFFSKRDGETFLIRYDALCPLFGTIWCLIILNEFLPERWARRVAAGSKEDARDARMRQLQAAEAFFTRVIEQHHD